MGRIQTGLIVVLVVGVMGAGCANNSFIQPTSVPTAAPRQVTRTATPTMLPTATRTVLVVTKPAMATSTLTPTLNLAPSATPWSTSTVIPTITAEPIITPAPTYTAVTNVLQALSRTYGISIAVTPEVNVAAQASWFVSKPESDQKPQADTLAMTRKAVVPILMYHYISVPPKDADRIRLDLSVTPDNFEKQLQYLTTYSYTTVSLYDVYNYLATGTALPPRPVVLTFDDGYRDAYVNAFALLKKYHMTGTFFIITDLVNSNNPSYLTWDMVKEMSAAGMSIESHTMSHPDMRNRSFAFLVYQILGPIEAITAYTGHRPHFFCYPYGRYDNAVIRVLASADTWGALTTQYGTVHTLAGAMVWPRVRVHGSTTLTEFGYLVKTS